MNINELHLKISKEALGVWSVMTHHLLSSLSLTQPQKEIWCNNNYTVVVA
jgi:hypothetical protein